MHREGQMSENHLSVFASPMNTPTRSETLAEALPKEIARCEHLVEIYKELGPVGIFARTMIQIDIDAAKRATVEMDAVGMLRAYEKLRGAE